MASARPDAWFRAQFNGWAFICQAMDETRQEAGALFEAVMTLPYACARNPQVTGGSMGGLIAQMVFAENKEFISMVSVVGRSSFYQADEWCREAQSGSWCDDWCAEHATQSHPERFTDRPLLFIDGALDTDCPAETNAETVRLINAGWRMRGTLRRSGLRSRLLASDARDSSLPGSWRMVSRLWQPHSPNPLPEASGRGSTSNVNGVD